MYQNIFDTHAHYDDGRFDADRDQLIACLPQKGVVAVVNAASDLATCHSGLALTEKYPFFYCAVGVHPHEAQGFQPGDLETLAGLAGRPRVVAIGEIGLDYYWAENPPRPFQQEIFRRQLALAQELDMPVIVHDREAHGDSLAIVKEFPGVRGVFHCYSGSAEMAQELVKLGWYLGFDGPITYKNARRAAEVAAVTPLERMVVETDSPYLSPVPLRGKRNDSRNLTYVLETLAAWKGVTPEEMARITLENGKRLYRLE